MAREIKFPEEYGFARIGSVIDYSTRELYPTFYAFEMGKLKALNLLVDNTPVARLTTRANSFSTSRESAWSTSVDSKLKTGFLVCNAELGFHADVAAGEAGASSGMTLDVSYEVSGYEIVLSAQAMDEQLYQCATPLFQKYYKAVADAATPEEWLLAYQDFHDKFGHGFINKLKFTSYASGSLDFSYTSSLKNDSQKWGGSFAISSITSSFSASAEYASRYKGTDSSGQLRASVFGMPAESQALNWVKGVIDTYTGKGIDKLLESPPENMTMPATSAKAPDIAKVVLPPEKPLLPEAKLRIGSTDELINYLKVKNYLKEHGSSDIASLEDFMRNDESKRRAMVQQADASIRQSLQSASAGNIAAESLKIAGIRLSASQSQVSNEQGAERGSNDGERTVRSTGESSTISDFDLGGFAISGFEFKPYSEFFPALAVRSDLLSLAGVNVVKQQIFVMMQQLISQYLNYVKDLPEALRGNTADTGAAQRFETLVRSYAVHSREVIKDRLARSGRFSADDYTCLRKEFFTRLHTEFLSEDDKTSHLDPDMYILNLYFLQHFEMLSKAPFGFALNVHNNGVPFGEEFRSKRFYLTADESEPFLKYREPFPAQKINVNTQGNGNGFLSEKCRRFMPIIRVTNKQASFVLATYVNRLYTSTDHYAGELCSIGVADSRTRARVPRLGATDGWAVVASLQSDNNRWVTCTIAPLVVPVTGYEYTVRMLELQPGLPDAGDPDEGFFPINQPQGYVFSGNYRVSFMVEQPGRANSVVSMAAFVAGEKGLRCDVGFIPVGYEMARFYKVQGIPMWCEFPLEQFEAAARGIY